MTGLSLRPRLEFERILRCKHCRKSISEHSPDCPQGRYDTLVARRKLCACPVCKEGPVELNKGDYFECHSCKTQFSRARRDQHANPRFYLDFPDGSDFVDVVAIEGKGEGDFPLHKALLELEQLLNQPKKRRRRK